MQIFDRVERICIFGKCPLDFGALAKMRNVKEPKR